MVQRHLIFPSVAALQVECGQSLQSAGESHVGSSGGSQLISIPVTSELTLPEPSWNELFTLNGKE